MNNIVSQVIRVILRDMAEISTPTNIVVTQQNVMNNEGLPLRALLIICAQMVIHCLITLSVFLSNHVCPFDSFSFYFPLSFALSFSVFLSSLSLFLSYSLLLSLALPLAPSPPSLKRLSVTVNLHNRVKPYTRPSWSCCY